jgi:hypothetical protein
VIGVVVDHQEQLVQDRRTLQIVRDLREQLRGGSAAMRAGDDPAIGKGAGCS